MGWNTNVKLSLLNKTAPFIWSANADGLAIRFSDIQRFKKAQSSKAESEDRLSFIRMQMLAECGQAQVRHVDGGIFLGTSDAVRLDDETRDCFNLPSPWPGGLRLQTESVPQLSQFKARLALVNPGSNVIWQWRLRGPILEANDQSYLPTAAQYAAMLAYSLWRDKSEKSELINLSLLATLREAKIEGCRIELEAYQDIVVSHAKELFLNAREDPQGGGLVLRPVTKGNFPSLNADQIEERIAQLGSSSENAILRVGKTIVLLNPEMTAQAKAIAERGKVPQSKRDEFEKDPSAWLAENVFPDFEMEFSPRVTGIGVWKGGYLGAGWDEAEDWFGKQPEIEKPEASTREQVQKNGQIEDLSREQEFENNKIVPLIIPNDDELRFGWRFPEIGMENETPFNLDFDRYARTSLPHQKESVYWLLGNSKRALNRLNSENQEKDNGAGALLADDMGLGKTFGTLMFIAEWIKIWRQTTGSDPPATLIVAPLSLLENWKSEIKLSFRSEDKVFTRILTAQIDAELSKVKRSPTARDIAVPGEVQQYGLWFGDGNPKSIDFAGGCVLTTYQTLRDYRFSFAKAQWGAVIFDEAQNIKNPNALQTIAAKSLKGIFRIALTGTPVENHLGDFWCILDCVEPGPMGSFAEFRKKWILRISREKDRMTEIGQELRDFVGPLMLRRMKEDLLDGLPKKTGDRVPIPIEMKPQQVAIYDSIISSNYANKNFGSDHNLRNWQLAALWKLRQVSLHPDLLGGGNISTSKNPQASREILGSSGKTEWLLNQLDEIRQKGEKVLIFCVQKKLQEGLSFHLSEIYGLTVPVINGDVKATSKQYNKSTRQELIRQFSDQPGFAICILSPIAAGAGLNIQAANHVIHLERHWNPAKEDQATDRVYRIGQCRPVYVYLPTCTHPDYDSFDCVLHRLISRKRALQGALGLIPPESVTGPEIINEVFKKSKNEKRQTDTIGLEDALKMSWRLFEALIATIYKADAEKVILTPGGSDHGCDVVVLGWGKNKQNVLIQCKQTAYIKLDSERAIREIEGARPFYEKALMVKFQKRCLHTTAKKISRRTLIASQICGVSVYNRSWLSDNLKRIKIEMSTVLAADNNREKIF